MAALPDILIMRENGYNQHKMAVHAANDRSPDGKRIVFSTNRDGGSYKLYIMNAEHSGLIPMTQGSSAELNPFWGR